MLCKCLISPSTSEVSSVTLAAFLRPAGRLMPIFSSLSRNTCSQSEVSMAALHQSQLTLPPSLDLALLSTPPSSEALRHSGGDNLLWTSAMVTLYLLVEDSSDSRPGVEQKMSVGSVAMMPESLVFGSRARIAGNRPSSSSCASWTRGT